MRKSANKREVLEQSAVFKLSRVHKNGKKWYEIQFYSWQGYTIGSSRTEEVRNYFGNAAQDSLSNKWKFKNRQEAYKKYTWANMRWN